MWAWLWGVESGKCRQECVSLFVYDPRSIRLVGGKERGKGGGRGVWNDSMWSFPFQSSTCLWIKKRDCFERIQLGRRHFEEETLPGWGSFLPFLFLSLSSLESPVQKLWHNHPFKFSFNIRCLQVPRPLRLHRGHSFGKARKRLNIKLAPPSSATPRPPPQTPRLANEKHLWSPLDTGPEQTAGKVHRQKASPSKLSQGSLRTFLSFSLSPFNPPPHCTCCTKRRRTRTHLVGTLRQLGHFLHAARHVERFAPHARRPTGNGKKPKIREPARSRWWWGRIGGNKTKIIPDQHYGHRGFLISSLSSKRVHRQFKKE